MNSIIILAAAVACIVLVSIFAFKAIALQQRTIDRLTDKLMAGSYKEFVTMQPKVNDSKSKGQKKEPLSWYDDQTVEEDEVQ